jgi:hypothetical protein
VGERNILFVVTRTLVPEERLVEAVAQALGIAADDVALLGEQSLGTLPPAIVEMFDVTGGEFTRQLTVYVDPTYSRVDTDLQFATGLARALNDDVLTPLPSSGRLVEDVNPYLWLLVRPDGAAYRVSGSAEAEADDEDAIVLDQSVPMVPYEPAE